jgi:hypothetical protein
MKPGLIEQAWDMTGFDADMKQAAGAFVRLLAQRARRRSWMWTSNRDAPKLDQ